MLTGPFMGRGPTHFHVNSVVKSYIMGESFLWSAWNLITPIFAVFVVNNIKYGDIQLAASGYSIYLVSRVIFELLVGPYLSKSSDRKKFMTTIIGMLFLSVSYIGFSQSTQILQVFLFYATAGIGLGIATPAKNSLFSMHLDKNKEPAEWGIADGISFICMALATALGGFIAGQLGFKVLFYVAAVVNLVGVIPYLPFLRRKNVETIG